MPFTLQQLSDAEDIKILKHRYFRAIDMADKPLLETLFTDDVRVEYRGGEYKVALTGEKEMIDFLLTSFNSDATTMHHGHMPEITFVSDTEAEGVWYLEDLFISREPHRMDYTIGSAIYKDRYLKVDGEWKIAVTEYDRLVEIVEPLGDRKNIAVSYLSKHGRKPEERTDISNYLSWTK